MNQKIYRLGILILFVFLVFVSGETFAQRNFGSDADQAFETEQYTVASDLYKQAYNKIKKKCNLYIYRKAGEFMEEQKQNETNEAPKTGDAKSDV